MTLHGLDQAWEQAGLSGGQSQNALAWAQNNPMGASLRSADPMARMASQCARALGLPTQQDEPALVESMRQELLERGLNEAGWALLSGADSALRDQFSAKILACAVSAKSEKQHAARALQSACQGASAAAQAGLSAGDAALFVETLSSSARAHFSQGLPAMKVSTAAGAALVEQLAQAKAKKLPQLLQAIARDWKICVEEANRRGLDASMGVDIARQRCQAFCQATTGSVTAEPDWRGCEIEGRQAWEFYAAQSPDLSATLAAARAEGGLARWCAQLAKHFPIKKAADSNDLIGQVKACAKEALGISEGAWKLAIKSVDLQEQIGAAAKSLGEHRGIGASWPKEGMFWAKSLSDLLGEGEGGLRDGAPTRMGLALNIAASQSLSASSVSAVWEALSTRRESELLFSLSVPAQSVDGVEAAAFFRQEAQAKSSRLPKIFKEACKRFEKLQQDRKDAPKVQGERALSAKEALGQEVGDLVDWLKGSEHGLWQTLAAEPTWGQLSRLSKAWHDEVAAREADRVSREKAKEAEREFERRFAPFAPHSGERWSPILGAHARDGWEAVELLSQSELSEEGKAMSHCVSGYSGYCREGQLRIFSIRLNGERKCTMELRAASGSVLGAAGEQERFKITQNRGRHNASVSNAATLDFCKEVAREAGASWSKKWQETQKLIEQKKEAEREKKRAQQAQNRAKKEPEKEAPEQAGKARLVSRATLRR